MAPHDPLKDCIKSDKTALGVWANDPETVELCAALGFDWIMIDMMFTGMDFRDVQNMIRACQGAGITPVVRMQTNPWHGYDARIGVDLTRLQGIGAEYVLISHSGLRERLFGFTPSMARIGTVESTKWPKRPTSFRTSKVKVQLTTSIRSSNYRI
jgi:hypothetical protein